MFNLQLLQKVQSQQLLIEEITKSKDFMEQELNSQVKTNQKFNEKLELIRQIDLDEKIRLEGLLLENI